MNKKICGDKDCKEKVHFYKPEMASEYTHKIITHEDGSEEWVPIPKQKLQLPKKLKGKDGTPAYFDENTPLNWEEYDIEWV